MDSIGTCEYFKDYEGIYVDVSYTSTSYKSAICSCYFLIAGDIRNSRKIFRWGHMVYSSRVQRTQWDGNFLDIKFK